MELTKERVLEVLESMATQTTEGARRVRDGARMLATVGTNAESIETAVRGALFHASVLAEAARLLGEDKKP